LYTINSVVKTAARHGIGLYLNSDFSTLWINIRIVYLVKLLIL